MTRSEAVNWLINITADIGKAEHSELWHYEQALSEIREILESEPERKTGKWIDGKRMKNDGTFYWFRQCDQCGYERNDCDTEKDSNFCPDCGADMRQIGE